MNKKADKTTLVGAQVDKELHDQLQAVLVQYQKALKVTIINIATWQLCGIASANL